MAITNVSRYDSLDQFRVKTNELSVYVGDKDLTTVALNITDALNELDAEIGDIANLTTSNTADITAALNALQSDKVELTSATRQDLTSDFYIPSGNTFTIDGTLDISSGSLYVPATSGALNVSTTFLNLGDGATAAADGGLVLSRGPSEVDVSLIWDEGEGQWLVSELNDSGNEVSSRLVTRYNAKELFANNTETGITVAWDATNQNFDISIDDNGLALGTKTTGDYVAGIQGTANEIVVTNSGGEGTTPTIGLVDNPVANSFRGGNVKISNTTIETTAAGDLEINTQSGAISLNDNTTVSGTLGVSQKATLGELDVTGDAVINGDLIVKGSTTTVESNTVAIGDNIITLNADESGTPSQDAGFEVERGINSNVSILWNETSDRWTFTDLTGTYPLTRAGYDTVANIRSLDDNSTLGLNTSDELNFSSNSGIDVSANNTTKTLTVNHADTSSQADVSNTGGNVIQSLDLDTYGHLVGISSVDLDDRYYSNLGGTVNGQLAIKTTNQEVLKIIDSDADGSNSNPMIGFYQNTARRGYVQFVDNTTNPYFQFVNEQTGEALRIFSGTGGLTYVADGNSYEVWHSGNDGAGSGLDADKLDGQSSAYFLDWGNVTNKPDPSVSLSGDVTGSATMTNMGSITISTSLAANTVTSSELNGAVGLTIYNSAGTALKTLYGAGS